ncbi:hypothetical protein RYX36_012081 [Vicia faba]
MPLDQHASRGRTKSAQLLSLHGYLFGIDCAARHLDNESCTPQSTTAPASASLPSVKFLAALQEFMMQAKKRRLIQFEASLKWKQSLPQQPILDSWIINNSSSTSTQIPCSWRGITCDSKGTVTILNLAYAGLQGIVLAEEQKRLKEDGENLTTKARELGEHNLGLQNQISEPEMKSKERQEELSVIMKKLKDNEDESSSKISYLTSQLNNLQADISSLPAQKNEKKNQIIF